MNLHILIYDPDLKLKRNLLYATKELEKVSCASRVGKGISAQAAQGTVRESLPSYGSCYPIKLLFQSSNDKTTMGFQLATICIYYTIAFCHLFYICALSIYGLVHSNNKIPYVHCLC